jgi:hypothetical protein
MATPLPLPPPQGQRRDREPEMTMQPNTTAADLEDRNTMVRLYQERGPMTDKELVAAGISLESQARNASAVAEMVRLLEMAEAA